MNECKICKNPTKNKCSNCCQIYYCSAVHQKADWKSHKSVCRPFKVCENEELGRHLISTRNIKAFEVLIKEAPLVKCPSQSTVPVCIECLNAVDETNYFNCKKCGWPLCCQECTETYDHKDFCELSQKRGNTVNIQDFSKPHPIYQCIGTVFCLLLQKDKTKWEKFQQLESLENRRRGSMQWKLDLESIGKFIPKFFKTTEFEEEEIMKAVGRLQTNGHEVPTTDPSHVAIFYDASLLEHSCVPNLAKSFTKDGHIVLWNPKPIQKDTHLSICYTDAVWGVFDRQHHLMYTKLFKCECVRCLDISEFGTYYNSLKCDKSDCKGMVSPTSLNERNLEWKCDACENIMDKMHVKNLLEQAQKDLSMAGTDRTGFIKFLDYYTKVFSNQHFLICKTKLELVQLICQNPKELILISDDLLQKKIDYTKELLKLYEKLSACEVRLLGTLCFDLHAALAECARRSAQGKNTENKAALLEESLHYVEKCLEYLQYEPELFIEGHICKQAKINREALNLVIKN